MHFLENTTGKCHLKKFLEQLKETRVKIFNASKEPKT